MNVHPPRVEKLVKRLRLVIEKNARDHYRQIAQTISDELGVDAMDVAAALLQLSHPHLLTTASQDESQSLPRPEHPKQAAYRNVRYRLDIGSIHAVEPEQILNLLVEESGVDKKRIARLEIREHYCLVDLPEGMPADVFQLLLEAEVNGQRLNIKRIKPNRKPSRGFRGQNRNS